MNEGTVIIRLTHWARWKMQSGVELGYKRRINFIRLAGENSAPPDCGYNLECQQTDEAVNQLPVVPREVIRVEYLSTARDEDEKARRLGISVSTLRRYRQDAYRLLG